ncbi:MAG: hypothetical protein ACHQ2Y_00030 [Candidatus Lutacidiplasmatales archaeon]
MADEDARLNQGPIAALVELERAFGGPVISYVTSDRAPLAGAIAEDAIRVIHRHLGLLGTVPKLFLFIYTRGGDALTPPRLVSLLREHAKELYTIVPYRAHSAGTSVCLGANGIYMGEMGELSPVDPMTVSPYNPVDSQNPQTKIPISVEDVRAYFTLSEQRAGLVSEDQRTGTFGALVQQVHPLALGNVQRVTELVKLQTPELLRLQLTGPEERPRIEEIAKVLTETYTHDHKFSRDAAKRLGLKILEMNPEMEAAAWKTYEAYESDLALNEPFDPESLLGPGVETAMRTFRTAYIESTPRSDALSVEATISRKSNAAPTVLQQLPGAGPGLPIPFALPRPAGPAGYAVNIKAKGWGCVRGG